MTYLSRVCTAVLMSRSLLLRNVSTTLTAKVNISVKINTSPLVSARVCEYHLSPSLTSQSTSHKSERKVGDHFVLHCRDQVCPKNPNPLLVMYEMYGARQSWIKKYVALYHRLGFDVLCVKFVPRVTVSPERTSKSQIQLLDFLSKPEMSGRPIIPMLFSAGGYSFSRFLLQIRAEPEKWRPVTSRIVGIIADSLLVSPATGLTRGFAVTLTSNPKLQKWLTHALEKIQSTTNLLVKQDSNTAVERFAENSENVPALFIYSKNDFLSSSEVMEDIIEQWRKRGIVVMAKCYDNSFHIRNYIEDPIGYEKAILEFLQHLNIPVPPQHNSHQTNENKSKL